MQMQFSTYNSQPQNLIFKLPKLDHIRLLHTLQTINLVRRADKVVGLHTTAASVVARSNNHQPTVLFPAVQKRLAG